MNILTQTTKPSLTKNSTVNRVALLYAAVLVLLAVTQLFSFDDFLQLNRDYMLPGGRPVAYLLATTITIAEVLAIPYLLRMRLSVSMRLLSMVMGWLVAGLWLGIALWLVLTNSAVPNVGLLGSVLALTPGWLSVLVGLIFSGLAAWVSWGMWPVGKLK